ncbi:PaaI family thioesterase [Stappia sp.]|uniref:PaaI family thioesterase n=1 Tax=Stappia sp. TaxID=1870903 RepID=UPI0032D96BDD
MTIPELNAFIDREFPQVHADGRIYRILEVSEGTAVMSVSPQERHLRPGGTVSGPTMMTLVDLAAYVVILAHIGPVALAVTTNLNMNFLRKPAPGDLIATCRLLKLGKRLAVVDCGITGRDGDDLVAHATATYSIPPR